MVSRYSTWRPIPLSRNFITSLFKLQRSNLRMSQRIIQKRCKCLLQCMDIRNLDLPTFKRFYKRIHFADSNTKMVESMINIDQYRSIVVYWGYCQIRISISGSNSEHTSTSPPRFWVHSLSYIAVSTCLLL